MHAAFSNFGDTVKSDTEPRMQIRETDTTMHLPVDLTRKWDVAIVGTGMGGATLGHALAKAGLSVLFLEKGTAVAANVLQTDAAESIDRMRQGWWPFPVTRHSSDGRDERFFAAVGCALGGSSIHYAAALERMAPSDFEPLRTKHQQVPAWPVGYSEFSQFYEQAETIYGLRTQIDGTGEQLLSEWDRALMASMRKNGLKPERLHVAMRYDENCEECIGRVCPRQCKADARTACLEFALGQPACRILEGCEVQTLEADESRVRCIRALHRGIQVDIHANIVVLATGAYHSPQILLRSRNSAWPNGLANRSDQVGRNLMFHTADLYALWAPRRFNRQGRQRKSISVRDFYVTEGRRLGYVQSMGLGAGRGNIASFLKDMLRRRGLRHEFLLSLLVKLPSHVAAWALGEASIFAAMTEDDPDPNNRIVLNPEEPDGASFTYDITDDLRERADALRYAFARHVRPWRLMRLSPTLSMNYGHPCGTCRFGDDPAISVLNRDNRAHDVENLYVVDASFMPRSGAVNPSLTIAANALRSAVPIARALG
jgi:choline dehydrogenase-like flavoprotein